MRIEHWFYKVPLRVRSIFRRNRVEEELAEELRYHLDQKMADNISRGMTRETAYYAALRAMDGLERHKEVCRDARGVRLIENLVRDIRLAIRVLRNSPRFTIVAVLSLCLGFGANCALFQLLDTVGLRTLPVANPRQLVLLDLADRTGWRGSLEQAWYPVVTNPIWEYIRDHEQAFAGVFAWGNAYFDIGARGESQPVRGLWVSGDFFRVLGVQPLRGRVFGPADDRPGGGLPGAVISYGFWQKQFGSNPAIIGEKVILNSQPVEVIGVTPPSFYGLEVGHTFDVAVPICAEPVLEPERARKLEASTVWWLTIMARLKPGKSMEEANSYLNAISPDVFRGTLRGDYPAANVNDYLKFKLVASPAGSGVSWLRQQFGDPLLMLLGLAALVLLIACANLANLMLARARARQREMAVRAALGASRGQLARPMLVESLMVGSAGAILGLLISRLLSQYLVAFLSTQGNVIVADLTPDWRVLTFTTGLALLTCSLFGIAPAVLSSRTGPGESLKVGGRTTSAGGERFGLRKALVVAQVALSLVLLIGSMLFSRSIGNLLKVDAGFRQDDILITTLDFSKLSVPTERRSAFKQEILTRIRAIPGLESAAQADPVPLSGNSWTNRVWLDAPDSGPHINANFSSVGTGYFKTLGTPMMAGRDFTDSDTPASPTVAIVNEEFVRALGLEANPVGMSFRREATPHEPETVFEIVGVVRNTKYSDLREDFVPIVFRASSQDQNPGAYARILIHSRASLGSTSSAVKQTIAGINPEIALDSRIFKTQIQESLLRERLLALLSQFFGALAALLTIIGLYGVISYTVARRTNEIGIRMALGARRTEVMLSVLRELLLLVSTGLAAGILCALAAGRLAADLLFGLKPSDPMTLGLAAFSMIVIGLLAGYFPARRASRVDPMVALRYE